MLKPPTVYNLSWFSRVAGEEESPALVARHSYSTLSVQKQIGVVILYPSLTTPEIVASDSETLELLMLTQADADLPARIRSQLKISAGFDPKKTAADRDLFVGADGNMVGVPEDGAIETQVIPFGVGQQMSTKSGRFKGYVDKRVHKLYVDAGYTKLYRVSLSNKCLAKHI